MIRRTMKANLFLNHLLSLQTQKLEATRRQDGLDRPVLHHFRIYICHYNLAISRQSLVPKPPVPPTVAWVVTSSPSMTSKSQLLRTGQNCLPRSPSSTMTRFAGSASCQDLWQNAIRKRQIFKHRPEKLTKIEC